MHNDVTCQNYPVENNQKKNETKITPIITSKRTDGAKAPKKLKNVLVCLSVYFHDSVLLSEKLNVQCVQ